MIYEEIENLLPKWNELLAIAKEIDTSKLQRRLLEKVFSTFKLFKPLRYKIVKTSLSFDREQIVIGRWIRLRSSWQDYGSPVDGPYTFLALIKAQGEAIADYVRKPVRSDFREAARIVAQLKLFEDVSNTDVFSPPLKLVYFNSYASVSGFEPFKFHASYVEVNSRWPSNVIFKKSLSDDFSSRFTVNLRDIRAATILQQTIDHLLPLYRQLEAEIERTKTYNAKLFQKLEDITAPYLIKQSLR